MLVSCEFGGLVNWKFNYFQLVYINYLLFLFFYFFNEKKIVYLIVLLVVTFLLFQLMIPVKNFPLLSYQIMKCKFQDCSCFR